jgi:dTDP-4-amino-4,6-dideoxygalactose transaminase
MSDLPAVLGGERAAPQPIPMTQPSMPSLGEVTKDLADMFSSRMITNHVFVRRFEDAVRARIGCEHAVAMSSCTSGLMLALARVRRKGGSVVLPSYTFSATGHAIAWNGLRMRPVDIDPETFMVDVDQVQRALAARSVVAVMAVHLFGLAAPVDALRDVCEDRRVPVIYDSAHALGASHGGRAIGNFGMCEVFSLSPTKVVVSGEGGIVTTNDGRLADYLRMGRNYGDDGTGRCAFSGINARMSELHASLGYHSLAHLDENLERRKRMVLRLKDRLSGLPGITFQRVDRLEETTYKDFATVIDPRAFGLRRDEVRKALAAEGIATKTYFDPPVHRQPAFRSLMGKYRLPVSERLASRILNLPMYSHIEEAQVDAMAHAMERIHGHASEVRAAIR